MASVQCNKPTETVVCHKTTTETCHSKGNQGHSFTDKVKEIAHSVFDHKNHQQNSGEHCHKTPTQQDVPKSHDSHAKNHCPQSAACHATEKGHGGNFISNIGEQIKHLTSRKKKNRKNRTGNCDASSSGSSSSSSDESDNEACQKKTCA